MICSEENLRETREITATFVTSVVATETRETMQVTEIEDTALQLLLHAPRLHGIGTVVRFR